MVNTCGFIDAAKKDSIDTLLAAADLKDAGTVASVVAVGCLAERYGAELADALPEADAVLGFDDYPDIAERLRRILAGEPPRGPRPARPAPAAADGARSAVRRPPRRARPVPVGQALPRAARATGPASGPRVLRRLAAGPTAPLKIASGCDRRCAFCAIPSFRGSYLSRPVDEIVAEARWLVETGVREVVLVSENSTSYGKDLGEARPGADCSPTWTASTGWTGSGSPTCSRPRCGPIVVAAICRPGAASCPTSTCPSSTPPGRCCAGCAGSATPTPSSAC